MKIAFVMGRISTKFYKGLKNCWNRKGYVRLNKNEKSTQTRTVLQRPRRLRWVKLCSRARKLGRVGSPKKWFTTLRDAYVSMMVKLSQTRLGGLAGTLECGNVFGEGHVKEYDQKMIQEIYSILAVGQGQIGGW